MGSSGGGGGGYMVSPVGPPMPGLPVAGADSTIGSPFEYGKFQNFLPDIKSEGPNDVATGLRPDMFTYRSPSGVVAQGGGGGGNMAQNAAQGDVGNQIQELRNQLAQLQSGGGTPGYSTYGSTGPGGQFTPYSSTNQPPLTYANGGNYPGS